MNNRLHALGEIVPDIDPEKKVECEEINIFVDEDHVPVRSEDMSKRSAIVPVAAVCSGKDSSNPNRIRLENPLYLTEYPRDPEAFFNNLYGMMLRKYEFNSNTRITIHGDGANWIKKADDIFPNAVFAMDGFHLKKYEKKFKTYCSKETTRRITGSVDSGNYSEFRELKKTVVKDLPEGETRDSFRKLCRYFEHNRDAIQTRLEGKVKGRCSKSSVAKESRRHALCMV